MNSIELITKPDLRITERPANTHPDFEFTQYYPNHVIYKNLNARRIQTNWVKAVVYSGWPKNQKYVFNNGDVLPPEYFYLLFYQWNPVMESVDISQLYYESKNHSMNSSGYNVSLFIKAYQEKKDELNRTNN